MTSQTLDKKIQAALASATDLPDDITQPNLAEEILKTFQGRHSWLMKWGLVKMAFAIIALCFAVYQFFMQETMMAMIAYASLAIICTVAYAAIFLFIWVQMNHNTTVGEIKRIELQIALLSKQLSQDSS
jgi:CO dehydrogenase/acetyl-CoA synthase gamma subunit (corrinoid Fe-S protein)